MQIAAHQVAGSLIIEPPIAIGQYRVSNVEIGFATYLNGNGEVANTKIGRFCSIASGCLICPSNHRLDYFSTHPIYAGINDGSSGLRGIQEYDKILQQISLHEDFLSNPETKSNEVTIGNDVWIGTNCIILAGVHVGNGSVIGAGSVVTKHVPPYSVVAGNPAKIIRRRFDESLIQRLEMLSWWNLNIFSTRPNGKARSIPKTISEFVSHIELLLSTGQASYIEALPRYKFTR